MHLQKMMFYVKLLLIIVSIVSVLAIMYFVSNSSSAQIQKSIKNEHSAIVNSLNGHLESFNKDNGNILTLFTDIPGILNSIQAKNKKDFYKKASHFYKKYQALEPSFFGIQIILKDSSSFVNINSENMTYNESQKIETLAKLSLETQTIQIGFEEEALGYFYKIIHPLYLYDKFIGVIEFTYTIDAIVKNLNTHFGMNVAFIYKNTSNRKSHQTTLDNYIIQNVSSDSLYTYISQMKVSKRFSNFKFEDRHFHLYTYKLPDISNNSRLISFYDATNSINKRENTLNNLLLILIVLSTVSIILSMLIIDYLIRKVNESDQETKQKNDELHFNSRHNSLTKLPNINIMNEDILHKQEYSVILLVMDNSSVLNTSYGKDIFESIIQKCAQSLENNLTKNAKLYHINTGEFTIILSTPAKKQEYYLTTQIKSYFQQTPIYTDNIQTLVSFSMGIASHVQKKDCALNIFSQANIALLEARHKGTNLVVNYSSELSSSGSYTQIAKNIAILQKDLEEENLVPFYQAIVDTRTKEVFKYEVLARIKDETGKYLSPYHFMEAAEVSGLQTAITKQIIQQSFKYFEGTSIQFSINITKHDFLEKYLPDFLELKTHKHNLSPKNITLEILEDIAIENHQDIVEQINYLSSLGYVIAIDDFGVENSNISKLSDLNAQFIKIDGSFIKDIDTNKTHMKIVESLVFMAKKLDMKIIAEYVHNETIYNVVQKLDIDYSQGYYFSEPKQSL